MDNFAIPIDLTAFALSPGCCSGLPNNEPPKNTGSGETTNVDYRIAPITQPNYIGLRLDESLIQHDVLDQCDFHLTTPWQNNPRVTDLGTDPPALRQNRLGVYLHWSLPRLYRAAPQAADSNETKDPTSGSDPSQPAYRTVPNRWLVVRHLTDSEPKGKLPDFQTWVVESDRRQKIDDIPQDADLETDVTPFVAYDGNEKGVINTQAEVFIGKRNKYSGWGSDAPVWKEDPNPNPQSSVDLTIMNTANPLFPDYVPHNASVFSIVDSFEYEDGADTKHLVSATADYFVVGWHSKNDDGPLQKAGLGPLADRLPKLFLKTSPNPSLDDDTTGKPEDAKFQKLLKDEGVKGVLLHGAIYDVKYSFSTPPTSQAFAAAEKFKRDNPMEPLSIGSTPLDSVLTFLEAHRGHMADFFKTEEEKVDGKTVDLTERAADDIMDLATLLYAADDSYDSRVKAQDLLYTNNWSSSQGGFQWKFDGKKSNKGTGPAVPTDADVEALIALNEMQAKHDALSWRLQVKRWALFAEWWKFASDRSNYMPTTDDPDKLRRPQDTVRSLKSDIDNLLQRVSTLRQAIEDWTGTKLGKVNPDADKSKIKVQCKRSPLAAFFMKKDPTLSIAGLESGWPKDFLAMLTVRVQDQLLKEPNKVAGFDKIFEGLSNPIPDSLRSAADSLLAECLKLKGETDLPKGFQPWGGVNPFQPMFIEWEALYYHIDRQKWDVGVRNSRHGNKHELVRFNLTSDAPLYNNKENQKDYRWTSGRVLILPQPIFSLSSIVHTVLDSIKDPDTVLETDPTTGQPQKLTDDEKARILKGVENLKFMSAPLDGFTQHLLTRYVGTHVTPTIRVQGKDPIAMVDAYQMSEDLTNLDPIGFEKRGIEMMDASVNVTPYGNLMTFDQASYPGIPFKGVTHGQMMLTKLSIVDKFGQAIILPGNPYPPRREDQLSKGIPPPALYPCLSDFLTPDIIKDPPSSAHEFPNTIYKEPTELTPGEYLSSRFVQLPPSINQDARINAAFVTDMNRKTKQKLKTSPFWRETIDDIPETPIIGWIVTNYQDYGLQFFLPDGTFYREIRVGGPTETNVSGKWLPFDPPDPNAPGTGTEQLDNLIKTLSDPNNPAASRAYLQAFFDMINKATKSMLYAPSDYAAYANSLVGKPLALVNIGWSLELSVPALEAQNTLGNKPDDVLADLKSYSFPLKIGDADRPFDGALGYWLSDQSNGSTDWNNLYTYFPPDKPADSTPATAPQSGAPTVHLIEPANFQVLSPTYIDVYASMPASSDVPASPATATTPYTTARVANYLLTTLLIDPYTPVHGYTPILPIKSLQLPAWTIQAAFTRMTAFFRLGPNLLSQDVSTTYDETRKLDASTWYAAQNASNPPSTDLVPDDTTPPKLPPPPPSIRLPISGKKGLWQWLQPYDVRVKQGKVVTDGSGGDRVTRYNAMDVEQEDTSIRKDPPPYTFVEGYLQLARP